HRSAAWNQTGPNLPLRQDRFFAARKPHIARESKLASDPRRSSPDCGDGDDRSAAHAHQHVRERLQPSWAGRQSCGVRELCKEVIVRQKEPLDGAIENDHLYLLVGFESSDNLIQLRDRLWAEDIQWRDIKRDAPVAWRTSREMPLSGVQAAPLFSGVKIVSPVTATAVQPHA